jgi:hypothetical protein
MADPRLAPEDATQPGRPPEVGLLSKGYQYLTEQGELALARPELDLDGAQGQAEGEDGAADRVEGRRHLVVFHLYRMADPRLAPEDATQPGRPPEVGLLSKGYQYLTGAKVNSHWLGPNSTSTERRGRPRARTARRIGSRA